MSEIVIYQSADDQAQVEVRFSDETVWLTQNQIVSLFNSSKANISEHISNIYDSGELDQSSTVRKFRTVQKEGDRKISRERHCYNLDMIISVGYRVNSKRGTQFRRWATQRLRDYLVEGYAINRKRLEEKNLELRHLKNGISILQRAITSEARNLADAGALAGLLDRFSAGLSLLDDYDHETLDMAGKNARAAERIEVDEYREIIQRMESEFSSDVFAVEKDRGFESAVSQIYQTFGGKELYPTLEEKAATLLYLVVKNHAFTDGNKRIAAACFLYFLERNGMLGSTESTAVIDGNTLAAVTLFIAVSKPEEMDTVKRVVVSILNRKEHES
ncbi:MAG: hypothetical protein A2Z99_01135 [Treponema sp. GWB1_62_6]|nr:MAG: hypothetical protein A2Z99_01135 [Treponema sp. GWB1_62_6]OHE69007.1 MAG: hypothetical protein A2001_18365 [Treponema sp. GWC1_61_84]OHE69967.1 MAG: hypothetical protein A2413_00905 [Treponema sp. RIFOXYC1_FULL_61_9]HCM28500.1 death-on-curing protein [Treponema sp.]